MKPNVIVEVISIVTDGEGVKIDKKSKFMTIPEFSPELRQRLEQSVAEGIQEELDNPNERIVVVMRDVEEMSTFEKIHRLLENSSWGGATEIDESIKHGFSDLELSDVRGLMSGVLIRNKNSNISSIWKSSEILGGEDLDVLEVSHTFLKHAKTLIKYRQELTKDESESITEMVKISERLDYLLATHFTEQDDNSTIVTVDDVSRHRAETENSEEETTNDDKE